MAFRAPLLGYNTNVRHKGKLYHIQTEDSGVDHPHVITHLFADGGRIVATRKTSYADRVGSEGLADGVKKLMQSQHKAMFIALRDGVYDEDDIANDMQSALRSERPEDAPEPESAEPDDPEPLTLPPVVEKPAPPAPRATSFAGLPRVPNTGTLGLPPVPPGVALERAGLYRATQAATSHAAVRPIEPPQPEVRSATREPAHAARSLFGGGLVSDKRLDEVILSYLAANDPES